MLALIQVAFVAAADQQWLASGSWTSAAWVRERYGARLLSGALNESEQTDVTLLQYGQIGASILPTRRNGTAVQFFASGRWRTFATDVPDSFRHGGTRTLYQAYVDVAMGGAHATRVRLGRQYLPNTSGFWRLDGARAERRMGSVTMALFGGNGRPSWEFDKRDAGLVGGDISARIGRHFTGRVGALASLDGFAAEDVDAVFVTAGVDVATHPMPSIHPVGAVPASVSLDLAYEPLMARIARAVGSGRIDYGRAALSIDYRYDVPQFPADSIFRVFAVDAAREGSASIAVRANDWLRLYLRHRTQWYDDDTVGRDRLEAAFEHQGERIGVIGFERLSWMEADRHYAYFEVRKWLTSFLRLGLGNSVNSYRRLGETADAFSRAARIQVEARPSSRVSFFGRLEQIRNADYRDATRAYVSLRTSFTTASGGVR